MNSTNRLLPNEILLLVCQYLSHSELQECVYVCKAWNRVVTPEYFREITLTREKLTKWGRSSLLGYSTENKASFLPVIFPSNAIYVTHLKMFYGQSLQATADRFYTVFYSMPNIEKIEFLANGWQEFPGIMPFFLRVIYDISVEKTFNNYKLTEHLQNIIIPYNYHRLPDVLQLYHSICSLKASSMTHLHLQSPFLTDETRKITYQTGEHSTVQDFLGKFLNLTHLEIDHYNDPQEIRAEKVFSRSIFVTCPRLVDLKIITYNLHLCYNNMYTRTAIAAGSHNEKSLLKLLNGTIDSNDLEGHGLSRFHLETYAESAEDLYNFIKYHKQLKVLNLTIKHFVLGEWWYEERHGDVNSGLGMKQFMEQLKSIPSISLSIGSFASDSLTFQDFRKNHYYNLINVFLTALSNGKRLCEVDLDLRKCNPPGLLIQANELGQLHISLTYPFDANVKEFFSDFLNIGVGRSHLIFDEQENYDNLSKINTLKLFNFRHPPYHTRAIMDEILIEAIENFPNLDKISISPETVNGHFNWLYELTSLNGPSYIIKEENNVKIITVTPSTKRLYKLVYKADYLPSPAFIAAISSLQIVYLELIGPMFHQNQSSIHTEVDFRNTFPYLEHLVLNLTNIEFYYDRSKKKLFHCNQFIKLEYSNPKQPQNGISKSCYYKLKLKKKQPFKNQLVVTECSENDMNMAKSTRKFNLVSIKVNDTVKTVKIFSE